MRLLARTRKPAQSARHTTRWRAAAVGAAAAAAVTVAALSAASPASATVPNSIETLPNQFDTIPTYFFGHTTVCFQNNNSDTWTVSAYNLFFQWTADVAPHSQQCLTRSWVGVGLNVGGFPRGANASAWEELIVYLPYGPNPV